QPRQPVQPQHQPRQPAQLPNDESNKLTSLSLFLAESRRDRISMRCDRIPKNSYRPTDGNV
ncbi:MAG TPA: hypothetical protein V6D26_23755, partial [Stenomitos sp.]